ncbi:hypothetical protein F5Y16DRAFT_393675 [Xylariaceae sp. FL0255]|nr:hypothetical protein F5Y16DRAFT_393675 [Xylariaceae sp. FL0255]
MSYNYKLQTDSASRQMPYYPPPKNADYYKYKGLPKTPGHDGTDGQSAQKHTLYIKTDAPVEEHPVSYAPAYQNTSSTACLQLDELVSPLLTPLEPGWESYVVSPMTPGTMIERRHSDPGRSPVFDANAADNSSNGFIPDNRGHGHASLFTCVPGTREQYTHEESSSHYKRPSSVSFATRQIRSLSNNGKDRNRPPPLRLSSRPVQPSQRTPYPHQRLSDPSTDGSETYSSSNYSEASSCGSSGIDDSSRQAVNPNRRSMFSKAKQGFGLVRRESVKEKKSIAKARGVDEPPRRHLGFHKG